MPILKKTKTAKKAPQIPKKPASRALAKAKNPKASKNPAAYYQCMCHQAQKGIKPKKITEVAHECKTNALTINRKMSAQKTKAVQKIKEGYEELGRGLSELIKASK
jgi:hypothetical protein